MDFYKSQETLTAMDWILRSIVSFAFLIIVAKFMGQRSISQLRFLDFIIALILGNIIAHPLSDEELGLEGSMITTAVIVLLYVAVIGSSLKSSLLKRFLDPPPLNLVRNGQIQYHNLRKARISVEFLFSELRKEKVEDIGKVSLAVWEPGGTVSVFVDAPYQPITPSDMQIPPSPFVLVKPIIIDGVINKGLLGEMNKDVDWLLKKLALSPLEIGKVNLATIDDNANIKVYSNQQGS
jgi:uncharacterized membrane protein YcaP (DUF421 family)